MSVTDLDVTTDEHALLGIALSGYPDLPDLQSIVNAADFRQTWHAEIWRAVTDVYAAGNTPDPLTVRVALGANANRLPGGPAYLHTLLASYPSTTNAGWYAHRIAAAATRERLDTAARRIHQLAETDTPLLELIERARLELDGATDTAQTHHAVRLADVIPDVVEIAENGQQAGLTTPWPDLDRFIGGLKKGRLYIVGARTGVGKSLMLGNLAACVAGRHKLPAFIATIEMSRVEMTQRITAAEARINLSHLENGAMTEADWQHMAEGTARMQDWPLWIDDSPRQSVATIRSTVRELQRRHPIGALFVDYLGLLEPPDRRVSRVEQIGAMTSSLKLAARELDVPVVLAAQLNREGTSRVKGSPPQLTDFRESGAIEQDADVCILIHHVIGQDGEETGDVMASVAKQRNGPRGYLTLQSQGHFARFTSTTSRNY